MCFSATASFVAAGITAAAGVACLTRIRTWREMPLAFIPLIFAVQQSIEGFLWLTLPAAPDGPVTSLLTLLFLLCAKVLWPAFAPVAALLIEPEPQRRRLMMVCCAAGAGVAAYSLWTVWAYPHAASLSCGHIFYSGEGPAPLAFSILYLTATTITPMLSSHRTIRLLGAIVFAGSVLAYFFYWEAFVSVWCFFAAAGSAVILMHFERVRRAAHLAGAGH